MTLPIERARSRRPITWLTLVGVLLLPAIIGGILVAALYNPTERLDQMTAAIVNNDEPVEIDGQYTPLGRQLAGGLVDGAEDIDSNLTWVLSDESDAAAGLEDGTYQAVITIPESFSAAATSSGRALAGSDIPPVQATIDVQTPPDSLIVDDAITAQVAQAAAATLGKTLSTLTLENVFLGFTTLGDELGEAANGASELADGVQQASDGLAETPGGAAQISDGAGQLSDGAAALQGGLGTIANGARDASAGATQLADGLDQAVAAIAQSQLVPSELTDLAGGVNATAATAMDAAAGTATAAGGVAAQAQAVAEGLGALAANCTAEGGSPEFCAQLAGLAEESGALAQNAGGVAQAAGGTAQAAGGTSIQAGYLAEGLTALQAQLPGGVAAQLEPIQAGARGLAEGLGPLAAGIDSAGSGAGELAAGAGALRDGATELSDGLTALSDGVVQLSGGTRDLADGLALAVEELPSYTESEASNLAEVVAEPVSAQGTDQTLFGSSAIPLLATLALWFGGLASYIAMQAVSGRALTSRRSSFALAARAFVPGAAIGAGQGLLVSLVVQIIASHDLGSWMAFTGVAVVAGIAFAAVNQALVAIFGGAGRWVAALVAVVTLTAGIVSTVPGALQALGGAMPTAPGYSAMVAALTSAGGGWAAFAGLVIWTLLALIATTLAVVRRRTTSARALLQTRIA